MSSATAANGRGAEFERMREWDNGVAKTRERQTRDFENERNDG